MLRAAIVLQSGLHGAPFVTIRGWAFSIGVLLFLNCPLADKKTQVDALQ
jgi:hypothetical protein